MRLRLSRSLLLLLGAIAAALAAMGAASAAYSTPGGGGTVTLASIAANTTDVEKLSDTPLTFRVLDDLTVSTGDTLLVAAGTDVEFQNGTWLQVFGGLEIRGTAALPVNMRVRPDAGGAIVDWRGIIQFGTGSFVIEHASFNASVNITRVGGIGAVVRDVVYEGGLVFVNAGGVTVERIVSGPGPLDVGQVPLWFTNCTLVTVAAADLTTGNGWGSEGVHIEASSNMRFDNILLRTDNPNLVGWKAVGSTNVTMVNYTFGQGPHLGNPGQALQFTDSEGIWLERVAISSVGAQAVGTIYGQNSNVTIANSTFPPGLLVGVWGPAGRLVGVNATRLPVRQDYGGEIREYELVRIEANWSSGGPVSAGSTRVENVSWNATGTIAGGSSQWLWLLRWWNDTVSEAFSTAYLATVTCNCTGGSVSFSIADEEGTVRRVVVDDAASPMSLVSVRVARTGEPGTLDASASFDNDQVAAYAWSGLATNVTGLPCSLSLCPVTFFAPGVFIVLLTLTDASGNSVETTVRITIADATRPTVAITSVQPQRPGQDEVFTVAAAATDNDPAFLPTVEWYVDGARVAGDTLTGSFHLPGVGTHSVRVVVKDDAGNAGEANRTVEVRDSTPPQVGEWSAPGTLIAPAQVTLNGSVAADNVAVVSWRWHVVGPGTDYNLTGEHPAASFPAAGVYNITLTATDAEGNQASRNFAVTVNLPPHGDSPGLEAVAVLAGLAAVAAVLLALRRRVR